MTKEGKLKNKYILSQERYTKLNKKFGYVNDCELLSRKKYIKLKYKYKIVELRKSINITELVKESREYFRSHELIIADLILEDVKEFPKTKIIEDFEKIYVNLILKLVKNIYTFIRCNKKMNPIFIKRHTIIFSKLNDSYLVNNELDNFNFKFLLTPEFINFILSSIYSK